jgi:hypothetical protein
LGDGPVCVYGGDDDGIHPRCEKPTTGTGTGLGTETETSADSSAFIPEPTGCVVDPDFPGVPRCTWECSIVEQDCPDGEKCSPWANDGGDVWNHVKCVPLDPSPNLPGETCVVEGSGVSGVDSCALGSMCWDVDPETNEGTCVPLCTGTEANIQCPEEDQTCVIGNEGNIRLCLPACDPRDPTACAEGDGCYPTWDGFACLPFGAQVLSDHPTDFGCDFPASCEPGTLCYADEVSPQCDDPPCCADWCDTEDPDPCPAGGMCTPFYEAGAAPTGFETLGWCEPIPGG